MAASAENDTVPLIPDAMSEALATHVSRAGLTALKPILEHAGVLTYACLGAAREDELQELCVRVRAAGFGLGHARALRELCAQAREARVQAQDSTRGDRLDDRLDDAREALPSSMSAMLSSRLAWRGLRGFEPVLAHSGVRSVANLETLSGNEREDLARAITAAGFNGDAGQAMAEITRLGDALSFSSSLLGSDSTGSLFEPAAVEGRGSAALERPLKRAKVEDHGVAFPEGIRQQDAVLSRRSSREDLNFTRESLPEERRTKSRQKPQRVSDEGETSSGPLDLEIFRRPAVRMSRDSIDEVLQHLRCSPAEIIRYRDKSTGKLHDARIPTAVLALLRLRASCTGKPVSEERIARLAFDVMEEQGFDPIRAFASLSPASLLCPTGAMRVLGTGCIGTVFLEEQSGQVVKVMLEDFAEKEFEVFKAFADAGLSAKPIGLQGPQVVSGGSVYSIRMEVVAQTLHRLLRARVPRGPRFGFDPPSEATCKEIAEALVRALERMWHQGLVHGDLHLENIALNGGRWASPGSSAGSPAAPERVSIQFIDFGRSARIRRRSPCAQAAQGASAPERDALRAGHEYDVFRLLEETCLSFDELQEEVEKELKTCEKEAAELRRTCQQAALLSSLAGKLQDLLQKQTVTDESKQSSLTNDFPSQLHNARQIVGLQAYVAEEYKTLKHVEAGYNAVLAAVASYAQAKLDFSFEGAASLNNRRMRQAVLRRRRACENGYFKSDLFWDSCTP